MKQKILNRDKNEKVVHEVRQHPFGMLTIWLVAAAIVIATLVGLGYLNSNKERLDIENISGILAIAGAVFSVIVILYSMLMTWLYSQNELIITNENIVEITQKGIFHKDVSQLNLAKIQDVSATHKGIFATIFKYGIITIETAGEKESFQFNYCPNASECAKEVIEAHQKYMLEHPTNINNPINNL